VKNKAPSYTVYYMSELFRLRFADSVTQEAKYVEQWPNTTSAWAGWSRFDILVDRYGGVHSLLICISSILGSPTCHRASQQENTYSIQQNTKKRTGPALWLLCECDGRGLKERSKVYMKCITVQTYMVRGISLKVWKLFLIKAHALVAVTRKSQTHRFSCPPLFHTCKNHFLKVLSNK
jgi:hypothetical protein